MMFPLDLFCSDSEKTKNMFSASSSVEEKSADKVKFIDLLKQEAESVLDDVTGFSSELLLTEIVNKRSLLVKEFSEIFKTLNSIIDDMHSDVKKSDSFFEFAQNIKEIDSNSVVELRSFINEPFKEDVKKDLLLKIGNLIEDIETYKLEKSNVSDGLSLDGKEAQKDSLDELFSSLDVVSRILIAEETGSYNPENKISKEISLYFEVTKSEDVLEQELDEKDLIREKKDHSKKNEYRLGNINESLIFLAENIVENKLYSSIPLANNTVESQSVEISGREQINDALKPVIFSNTKDKQRLVEFVVNSYSDKINEKSDHENHSTVPLTGSTISWAMVMDNEKLSKLGTPNKRVKTHNLESGVFADIDKSEAEKIVNIESMFRSVKKTSSNLPKIKNDTDKAIKTDSFIVEKTNEDNDVKLLSLKEKSKLSALRKDITPTLMQAKELRAVFNSKMVSFPVNEEQSVEVSNIIQNRKIESVMLDNVDEKTSEIFKEEELVAGIGVATENTNENADSFSGKRSDLNKNSKNVEHSALNESNDVINMKSDASSVKPVGGISEHTVVKEVSDVVKVDSNIGFANSAELIFENNTDAENNSFNLVQNVVEKLSEVDRSENNIKVDQYRLNQDVIDQIKDKIKMAFKPSIKEMKISLNPNNLGEVLVKVQMKELNTLGAKSQVMNVSFIVENDSVKETILSGLDGLKNSISETSMSEVESLSVMVRADVNQQQNKHYFSKTLIKSKKKKNFIEEIENDIPENQLKMNDSGVGVLDYQA